MEYSWATIAFWKPHVPRILTVDYTFKLADHSEHKFACVILGQWHGHAVQCWAYMSVLLLGTLKLAIIFPGFS